MPLFCSHHLDKVYQKIKGERKNKVQGFFKITSSLPSTPCEVHVSDKCEAAVGTVDDAQEPDKEKSGWIGLVP